jgi:hypothetical protein
MQLASDVFEKDQKEIPKSLRRRHSDKIKVTRRT